MRCSLRTSPSSVSASKVQRFEVTKRSLSWRRCVISRMPCQPQINVVVPRVYHRRVRWEALVSVRLSAAVPGRVPGTLGEIGRSALSRWGSARDRRAPLPRRPFGRGEHPTTHGRVMFFPQSSWPDILPRSRGAEGERRTRSPQFPLLFFASLLFRGIADCWKEELGPYAWFSGVWKGRNYLRVITEWN